MANTFEYTYKLQGNGKDSWKRVEKDSMGNIVNVDMVYDDPAIPRLIKEIQSLTPQERGQLKQLVNNPN